MRVCVGNTAKENSIPFGAKGPLHASIGSATMPIMVAPIMKPNMGFEQPTNMVVIPFSLYVCPNIQLLL